MLFAILYQIKYLIFLLFRFSFVLLTKLSGSPFGPLVVFALLKCISVNDVWS